MQKMRSRPKPPKVQEPPIKSLSIAELDARIEWAEGINGWWVSKAKEARRVRRNKLGGLRSGKVRRNRALTEDAKIRDEHATLIAKGEKGVNAMLMAKYGVSRSTLYRALRGRQCLTNLTIGS